MTQEDLSRLPHAAQHATHQYGWAAGDQPCWWVALTTAVKVARSGEAFQTWD
jgi:hypothetical protein